MLGNSDLTNIHHLNSLRRSVAMLPAHSKVLSREETLELLDNLMTWVEGGVPDSRADGQSAGR